MTSPITIYDERGTERLRGTQRPPSGGSMPQALETAVVSELLVNLSLDGAANVDGVDVVTGMRVLVTAQTDQTEQGVWLANTDGPWTRPDDFAVASELAPGTLVSVSNAGGAWVNTLWTLYNQDDQTAPIVVGTSPIGIVIVASDVAMTFVVQPSGDVTPTTNKSLDCAFNPVLNMTLPTVDPGIAGVLWNDAGTPAISTG